MKWTPIPIHEFPKSQAYREVAVFTDKIDAVASRLGAAVESYDTDGLGRARGFCVRSDKGEYAYFEHSEIAAEPDLISIAVDQRCLDWQAQVDAIAVFVGAKGLRWIKFQDLTGGL